MDIFCIQVQLIAVCWGRSQGHLHGHTTNLQDFWYTNQQLNLASYTLYLYLLSKNGIKMFSSSWLRLVVLEIWPCMSSANLGVIMSFFSFTSKIWIKWHSCNHLPIKIQNGLLKASFTFNFILGFLVSIQYWYAKLNRNRCNSSVI